MSYLSTQLRSTEVSDFKISSAGWQVNLHLCMLRKVLGDYLIAILTKKIVEMRQVTGLHVVLPWKAILSHLQKQSSIMNLRTLYCATSLKIKYYQRCVHSLSYKPQGLLLQGVENEWTAIILEFVWSRLVPESDSSLEMSPLLFPSPFSWADVGFLLPSMPSNAKFDMSSGISFLYRSSSALPECISSVSFIIQEKYVEIPALPLATSAPSGLYH